MATASRAQVAQFSPDAPGTPAPVGWVHLFHRADILKIAPLWLHYCERVRTEPERCALLRRQRR